MRTFSILTVTGIANAVAGSLFVFAFWQTSVSLTWALIGISIATWIAATSWSCLKFRKALRQLMKQSQLNSDDNQKVGVSELEEIRQEFSATTRELQQTSSSELDELAGVKNLLATIDRRQGDLSRDGHPYDTADRLRGILKGCESELDSNIRQAISCGREIHRATQEIVLGSESQSDSVEKTTSFIEQLSTRIISVCDNAESALESSTKAKNTANNGLQQFEELVDEMKQIRNHAAARERKLQALGQHTREIESIVQTIGTLSSRTDLLALNASIESVRAGEHGRGFAIVAEEVRALAEQSAQAVQDITRRIEMIQLETHQSISVASGEHDQMHDVIKRVTETVESLKDICDAAGSSADGLNEISISTNLQLQLTREIIVALERNTEATKKNRSRAEGANWTAKTLDQIGQQLEGSLSIFKLTDARESASGEATSSPEEITEASSQEKATPVLS